MLPPPIGSTVDVGVPERENVENFQTTLKSLTFRDAKILQKFNIASHEAASHSRDPNQPSIGRLIC